MTQKMQLPPERPGGYAPLDPRFALTPVSRENAGATHLTAQPPQTHSLSYHTDICRKKQKNTNTKPLISTISAYSYSCLHAFVTLFKPIFTCPFPLKFKYCQVSAI